MVSRKTSLLAATASGTLHLKWQHRLKYAGGQQGKSGWRGMLMRNLLLAVTEAEFWVVLIMMLHVRVQYTHMQK